MVTVSILTMFGLGLVCAGILAAASKIFYVQENPKVAAALELLPGANCGGCGFAGCEGYAKAVVTDPNVPANRCVACPKESIVALGELTGKTVAEAEPLVSMRRCDVNNGHVVQRYVYHGIPSCAAASVIRGGTNTCAWSCLGFGDCVQACPFGAMKIVDDIACVDIQRCTGCGLCTKACPRGILELIPLRSRVCIPCNSRDKGKAVMDACKAGCIKCGKCVRTCPAKAISLVDGRIEINQKQCLEYGPECGQACVGACARKILRPIALVNAPVKENAASASDAGDNENKEAANA
ncbi:MAG: Fe-S cluster domain-containing protein [Mailhella sp.]|nr:Fe-S cluster domain-containing protein [Mailhella sp.]